MSGKPPAHPGYSEKQLKNYPPEAIKKGDEAYQALVKGDTETYHKRSDEVNQIVNEEKSKGIAAVYPASKVNVQGGRKRTLRNTVSGGDIVTHLLTIRNQVKLYHWQTGSFARHKATDDLTAALDTQIDTFVESYMGRYSRPKVTGSIKLHNFSEEAARKFVAKETKYLSNELPRKIKKTDTDLLNVRDTILGDLNKVLYLFTLH
jgi:hypothetical protein